MNQKPTMAGGANRKTGLLPTLCFLIAFATPASHAQETALRKDAAACQLASAVITASGYAAPSKTNTDTVGTYTLASSGESDPIRIRTIGSEIARVEIAASAGTSVRILNGGLGRFHPSVGNTKSLSAANTFHERVPTNPALSMLAECASPNVQAIDGGEVTLDGLLLTEST